MPLAACKNLANLQAVKALARGTHGERYLEKLGLVEVDEQLQHGGAVEHVYRLRVRG